MQEGVLILALVGVSGLSEEGEEGEGMAGRDARWPAGKTDVRGSLASIQVKESDWTRASTRRIDDRQRSRL